MRKIIFLMLLCFSGVSSAATYKYSNADAAIAACYAARSSYSGSFCTVYNSSKRASLYSSIGSVINHYDWNSCVEGQTLTGEGGTCQAPSPPPPDPCLVKAGISGTHKKTWPSYAAYSLLGETTNNDGCLMTIDTMNCGLDGASGKYGCFGTGTYTGASAPPDPSDSTSCAGGADPACETPPPVTSTQTQSCTPNTDGNFTCTSTSGSNQYSSSQCAQGTVNGVTGFHCTKPSYQPGSSSNTQDDTVTTTANGDGTTTTTTTSTANNTHCKAGECTTTTTTTTNNIIKDGNGNVVSDDTTCSGPNCPKPTDDTGQEDGEEEGVETGGEFTGPEVCDPSQGCIPTLSNPFGDESAVVPGYGESFSKMWDGISDSPLISSVSDVSFPKGGSCPTYTASLWGSTLVVNQHCGVLQSVGGVLSAVFLAMWAFIAIRVFLSA